MYSREEAARIKRSFWIAFGKYMSPIPSASGLLTNWINYKTGVKNIFFRLDADNSSARVSIEIAHRDDSLREIFFEQFQSLKKILNAHLNQEWNWEANVREDYKTISRISAEIKGVNVFNDADWPKIISFLKPRMIALDSFWNEVRFIFEELSA
jgi:hypothetical protein